MRAWPGNDIHTMSTLILERNLRDLNIEDENVSLCYIFFVGAREWAKIESKTEHSFKKEMPAEKKITEKHTFFNVSIYF